MMSICSSAFYTRIDKTICGCICCLYALPN